MAAFAAVGAYAPQLAGQGRGRLTVGGREQLISRAGWIRVGLLSDAKSVAVAVPDGTRVRPAQAPQALLPSGGTVQVVVSETGIIATLPNGSRVVGVGMVIEPPGAASGGAFQLGDRIYRGALSLQPVRGRITAVNEVLIDDYLKGVLPAEIGGEAPVEALKAQAIAARSEVVQKLESRRHASDGYDLCDGVHCMAYKGMKPETAVANGAVAATAGQVLTVNGKVLDAVYHNVCGGVTAPAEDVWDGDPIPGLAGVYDTRGGRGVGDLSSDGALARFLASEPATVYCSPSNPEYPSYARKYFRWEREMGTDELERRCGVGRIRDIVVVERRPSGRVRSLRIVGDKASKTVLKELPIRNLLDLWSGMFVMRTVKSQGFVAGASFTGGGNGHGVGMCQMGARTMATRGMDNEQILGHYFPGAQITRIYRP